MSQVFRWFFILIGFIVLISGIIYNQSSRQMPRPPEKGGMPVHEATKTKPHVSSQPTNKKKSSSKPRNEIDKQASTAAPNVSVIEVSPQSYEATVNAFGVAQPQYELLVKSQVSGHVLSMSDQFASGLRVKKSTPLLSLDDTHYRAALAAAKATLSQAKLSLLEEQREAVQAKAEWKTMGLEGQPDSKLVLHAPQLAAAKASLNEASANLRSAETDLQYTQVISPFNALVVERLVSPGSYVQSGTEVAKLYSSDHMEIALALPASDWKNLPNEKQLLVAKWSVELNNVEGDEIWQGYVSRIEQHLDETTRQRTLIVNVDHPLDQKQALYPGTFLDAKIKGEIINELWQLPSSAMSQRGELWYVSADNTIQKLLTKTLFADAKSIYVAVPKSLSSTPQKIITHPLNSYLAGMKVIPVTNVSSEKNSYE